MTVKDKSVFKGLYASLYRKLMKRKLITMKG